MDDREFWERVDVRGPDECWHWLGPATSKGGRYALPWGVVLAHRHAWEQANGLVPFKSAVVQKCGDKMCCNPAHLALGLLGRKVR